MNLRKLFSLICLLLFFAVTVRGGYFKPSSRAKTLVSGTYFIYNTCIVNGSTDYTGFYYSNGSNNAITVNHGPKPSTFSVDQNNAVWEINVVDEATGKCTMRNLNGYYVDNSGTLSQTESFIYITPYALDAVGACGNDVYAESEDETTSSLPSTSASENAGLWVIGNEDKSSNWTSSYGTAFKCHSAGQPMALYLCEAKKYTITNVGELSAPSTLTIGSKVSFFNVNTSKYVWEGTTDLKDYDYDNNKLFMQSRGPVKGESHLNRLPMVFEVGGTEGSYTFKNVATGNYIKALNQGNVSYTGTETEAEKFSLEVLDDNVNIKGSNNQYFNQNPGGENVAVLVGWFENRGNSNYKIAEVEYSTDENSNMDVAVTYEYQWNGVTQYTYKDVSASGVVYYYRQNSYYGVTLSSTRPNSEVLTENKTVVYNYTDNSSEPLPFVSTTVENGKFPSDAHWYKLQLRNEGKFAKYNASSKTAPTSTDNSTNDFGCAFIVTGNPLIGYKFQNLLAGAGNFMTIPEENGACTFSECGTIFDYSKQNNYNLFKARGTSDCYVHDYDNSLGVWRSSGAIRDIASSVVFVEVEDFACTISFDGIFEDIDRLIYDSNEYENGASISLPWSTISNINSGALTVKNDKQAYMTVNNGVVVVKYIAIKKNTPYLIKIKDSGSALYVDMINGSPNASLQTVGTPVYFTFDTGGKFFINTQPNGSGNWLGATGWNTNISSGKCSWLVEEADYDGVIGYKFKQDFANYTGYLGSDALGENAPLYDNKGDNNGFSVFTLEETTPFTPTTIENGDFAENTKWYNLCIRGSKYSSYDAFAKKNTNDASNPVNQTNSMYCFVKDEAITNGYKIYNYTTGSNNAYYNSSDNNSFGTFNTEGSAFILKENGANGFVFQLAGDENAHLNDVRGVLGVWNDEASRNDDGSTFLFKEVNSDILEVTKGLPQAGKFYTIQETTTSQYLTPNMSTVNTSRLAMDADASEADRIFFYTGFNLLGYNNGYFLANNSGMLSQASAGTKGTTFAFTKQGDGTFTVAYNDGKRSLYGAITGCVDGASAGQTGSGYKFNVTNVTELPLTIGTNGWTTFSAPVAVTVPEGVEAYYVNSEIVDGKVQLTEINGVVPANQGIIIKGTEGETINLSTAVDGAEADLTGNKLVANVDANNVTGAEGDGIYALATKTSAQPYVTGFMKLNTTIQLPGHKCYLNMGGAASSIGFMPILTEDDVTGIDNAEADADSANATIHDLQGRPVNGTQKGHIYIKNGKAFIAR